MTVCSDGYLFGQVYDRACVTCFVIHSCSSAIETCIHPGAYTQAWIVLSRFFWRSCCLLLSVVRRGLWWSSVPGDVTKPALYRQPWLLFYSDKVNVLTHAFSSCILRWWGTWFRGGAKLSGLSSSIASWEEGLSSSIVRLEDFCCECFYVSSSSISFPTFIEADVVFKQPGRSPLHLKFYFLESSLMLRFLYCIYPSLSIIYPIFFFSHYMSVSLWHTSLHLLRYYYIWQQTILCQILIEHLFWTIYSKERYLFAKPTHLKYVYLAIGFWKPILTLWVDSDCREHISILQFSLCLSVDVRKLQVAILARSSREMSQTLRIILSRVRISVRPRIFLYA